MVPTLGELESFNRHQQLSLMPKQRPHEEKCDRVAPNQPHLNFRVSPSAGTLARDIGINPEVSLEIFFEIPAGQKGHDQTDDTKNSKQRKRCRLHNIETQQRPFALGQRKLSRWKNLPSSPRNGTTKTPIDK
jgi:hypothetical protein